MNSFVKGEDDTIQDVDGKQAEVRRKVRLVACHISMVRMVWRENQVIKHSAENDCENRSCWTKQPRKGKHRITSISTWFNYVLYEANEMEWFWFVQSKGPNIILRSVSNFENRLNHIWFPPIVVAFNIFNYGNKYPLLNYHCFLFFCWLECWDDFHQIKLIYPNNCILFCQYISVFHITRFFFIWALHMQMYRQRRTLIIFPTQMVTENILCTLVLPAKYIYRYISILIQYYTLSSIHPHTYWSDAYIFSIAWCDSFWKKPKTFRIATAKKTTSMANNKNNYYCNTSGSTSMGDIYAVERM